MLLTAFFFWEVSMQEQYMRMALALAALAKGRTSPNPMVGAVVVKGGRVVGQGWHREAGTPHAEIHALRQAGELAKDADLYVTLEPCSHYGRTPPCCEAVLESGVKRVFAAMRDPNPKVSGSGLARLSKAGVEVELATGELHEAACRLNEVFLKWIMTKMPFVAVKTAMTLDGKIATTSGQSKWITGEAARKRVHELRDIYDGILVGIQTVVADDPLLTTRLDGGKSPLRIVADSQARLPFNAKLVTDQTAQTVVAVTGAASAERVAALEQNGVQVMQVASDAKGRVDLADLLRRLGQRNVCSVLVEGGASLNDSLFRAQLVDKVYTFIAPKIFGGKDAPTPIGGIGIAAIEDHVALSELTMEKIGEDFLLTGYVKKR